MFPFLKGMHLHCIFRMHNCIGSNCDFWWGIAPRSGVWSTIFRQSSWVTGADCLCLSFPKSSSVKSWLQLSVLASNTRLLRAGEPVPCCHLEWTLSGDCWKKAIVFCPFWEPGILDRPNNLSVILYCPNLTEINRILQTRTPPSPPKKRSF